MGMFDRLVRRGQATPVAAAAAREVPIDVQLGTEVTEQLPVVVPTGRGVRHVAAPAPAAASRGGFAVVDLLTTGPSPSRDRVVEVAVVQLDAGGALVREWSTLLSSPQALHPAARHGVDPEELWGAPTFDAVAGELLSLLAGRVLTAHGAAGVLAHLRAELARAGTALPPLVPLCTVDASFTHLPSLARRRLADCCAAAGTALPAAVTAPDGARAAAGLLRHFLTARAERSDDGLGRLTARAASTPWPVPTAPRTGPRPRTLPPVDLPAPARPPLAPLADALDLDAAGLPLPAAAAYAELLAELIATRPAGERCTQALAAVADVAALSPAQVAATHARVLRALAALARTGTAGAERRDLLAWAEALAVDPALLIAPGESGEAGEPLVVDLRDVPALRGPGAPGRRVPRQAGAAQPVTSGGAPA